MIKKTLILLSTYNGEKYLECLLDSLVSQTGCEFDILVRDDGSNDSTPMILDRYQEEKKLTWYKGENIGAADSFMNLIYNAPSYEYYALCDQDDYWEPDKLRRAIAKISIRSSIPPVLYYGCPRITDEKLENIDIYSNIDLFVDSFEGSLITGGAYGCTMVFNNSLAQIIKMKRVYGVYKHDVWIHKLCLIFNGILIYDDDIHIRYRQHGNNSVGVSKRGIQAFSGHVISYFKKECVRSRIVEKLYANYADYMTDDVKRVCKNVIGYRNHFRDKISIICSRKIKTDNIKRNILFRMAVLTNAY